MKLYARNIKDFNFYSLTGPVFQPSHYFRPCIIFHFMHSNFYKNWKFCFFVYSYTNTPLAFIVLSVSEQMKVRQHDPEETVRMEVVNCMLQVAKRDFSVVTDEMLVFIRERTLDKKVWSIFWCVPWHSIIFLLNLREAVDKQLWNFCDYNTDTFLETLKRSAYVIEVDEYLLDKQL